MTDSLKADFQAFVDAHNSQQLDVVVTYPPQPVTESETFTHSA